MLRFPDDLLNEFRLDWEAALRPDVGHFLGLCHPDFRDQLADKIGDYLMYAPTPPYSDVQRARLHEKAQAVFDSVTDRKD